MTAAIERDDALTADAAQAAYFRAELCAERALLLASAGQRPALIERPGDAGRARVSLTSAEVQLRHIDWLVAKLDSRFTTDQSEHA